MFGFSFNFFDLSSLLMKLQVSTYTQLHALKVTGGWRGVPTLPNVLKDKHAQYKLDLLI